MKCPVTSKCHGKLSDELIAAKAAHKKTIREDSATIRTLETINATQRWQLENAKVPITDLSDAARRKASGYEYHRYAPLPDKPCGKCDRRTEEINFNDKTKSFCGDYLHMVDSKRGTCPHHDLKFEAKRKIA